MKKFLILFCIFILFGCTRQTANVRSRKLASKDSIKQIKAIQYTVEKNRKSDIPKLISLLSDDDEAVQIYANLGLEKISGKDFGFEVYLNDNEKEQAIKKWKEWWSKENVRK